MDADRKKLILLRMIPWGERFDHLSARGGLRPRAHWYGEKPLLLTRLFLASVVASTHVSHSS